MAGQQNFFSVGSVGQLHLTFAKVGIFFPHRDPALEKKERERKREKKRERGGKREEEKREIFYSMYLKTVFVVRIGHLRP